ncbi:metallophosphoesterase family protein [Desulfotruncus alcoholivorax]|uniref:metallophosphoesterase family protein n=1 Tax=Desulfotruncus alcoholivorax TaxID=265477 RepID=UPI00041026E3|nr:DNA repair exonuclease [Desulfotruncus alcoholivorax]
MDTGFSFIHAADLHLDSPFRGYAGIDCEEETRENILRQLRDGTFLALDNLVRACIQNQVDFLVLAGDVYDQADRSLRAQLRLRDAFARLAAAGIPVFVAHGNHDHSEGFQAALAWPDNVHIFAPGEVEARPVTRGGKEIARVYGISYPRRDVSQNYASMFRRDLSAPFAVAVLHCNVGGNSEHADYAPCSLEDLAAGGFDYWALGHVHRRLTLKEHGPCVVYPGNLQGRGPHETGARGCYLVRVKPGGLAELSFLETDTVRWATQRVSIQGLGTEQELLESLDAGLAELSRAHGQRSLVARLELAGRGPLHRRLQRPGALDGLLEELRRRFTGPSGRFVWPESIRLRTAPEVDKESLRGSRTLLGDLLEIAREARCGGRLRDQLAEALAPLQGRAARFIQLPQGKDLDELIEAAEEMALDLLWEEDAR